MVSSAVAGGAGSGTFVSCKVSNTPTSVAASIPAEELFKVGSLRAVASCASAADTMRLRVVFAGFGVRADAGSNVSLPSWTSPLASFLASTISSVGGEAEDIPCVVAKCASAADIMRLRDAFGV